MTGTVEGSDTDTSKAKAISALLDHEKQAQDRKHQIEEKGNSEQKNRVLNVIGSEEDRLKRGLQHSVTAVNEPEDEEDVFEEGSKHFTNSRWFGGTIALTVLANAIQMGVELDHPENKTAYLVMENLFTAIFTIEMICKLVHERKEYFRNKWNCLDFGLVWMSILDCWIMGPLGGESDLSKLSALRMLRVMRVARMVRLLKVFRELWLIVKGMLDSIRTISWAACLLILIIYAFSLFFVRTIGRSPKYYKRIDDEPEEEIDYHPEWDSYAHFGNVPRAMFTLFETSLEPLNLRPIMEKQPILLVFFMFFIFLSTFGIMNVIVGVIVEKCTASAKNLDEGLEVANKMAKLELLPRLKEVCFELDEDQNGTITLDEIKHTMADPHGPVHSIVEDMELPAGCDSQEFCDLLDVGGLGKIEHHVMMRSVYRALMQDERQLLLEVKGEIHGLHKMMREILQRQQQHSQLLLELCRDGGTLDEIEASQTVLSKGLGILQDAVAESWAVQGSASSKSTQASDQQQTRCSAIIRALAEYDSKFQKKVSEEPNPNAEESIDIMMVSSTDGPDGPRKSPQNLRNDGDVDLPYSARHSPAASVHNTPALPSARYPEGMRSDPSLLYSNAGPRGPHGLVGGEFDEGAEKDGRSVRSGNGSSVSGARNVSSLRIPHSKPQPPNSGDHQEGHEKLQHWLSNLDSAGSLLQYYEAIAAHYDSPQQILDIYSDGSHHERFFKDAGVEKLGHQRLFEKWFADNEPKGSIQTREDLKQNKISDPGRGDTDTCCGR